MSGGSVGITITRESLLSSNSHHEQRLPVDFNPAEAARFMRLHAFHLNTWLKPIIPTLNLIQRPNQNGQDYLTKNKFAFPVLRVFEYGRSNGINAIADTWFVDTNGNRVYEGVACSKELVEEFI